MSKTSKLRRKAKARNRSQHFRDIVIGQLMAENFDVMERTDYHYSIMNQQKTFFAEYYPTTQTLVIGTRSLDVPTTDIFRKILELASDAPSVS